MSKRVEVNILWILACRAGRWVFLSDLHSKLNGARERARAIGRKRKLKDPLKYYSPVEVGDAEETIENLVENGKLERKGKRYRREPIIYPPPLPPIETVPKLVTMPKLPVEEKEHRIAQYIGTAKETPTAKEVAQKVGLISREVCDVCRRYEYKGFLTRGTPTAIRFLFAPIIGQNIHSGNYELAKSLYNRLRQIVARFDLKDPRLIVSVSEFFSRILGQKKYARYRKAINSYRGELIGIIRQAESKSDVYEFLGFKPYYRDVSTWASAV